MNDNVLKKRYDEESRMRWLSRYTDWIVKELRERDLTEGEAVIFLEEVRNEILKRFPDKEEEYNHIYDRRFKRILLKKGIYLSFNQRVSEKN